MATRYRASMRRQRRGVTLIYVALITPVLIGLGALAVDMSRVQAAKSELQTATDAAARYAATAMCSTSGNASSASSNAAAVFAQNTVDGQPAPFDPATDITLGIWSTTTRTFQPASLAAGANAVRLQTKLTLGDAARPLTLASLVNQRVTLHANAIAMMNGRTANSRVDATGNPWLAGMPAGSVSNNWRNGSPSLYDMAGNAPNKNESPGMISLSAASISPGATIMFDSVTGNASNSGNSATVSADGNAGQIVSLGTNGTSSVYLSQPMNGIANIRAPINAMIAIFLNDNAPNTTAAPQALDFMSAAQRDYTSLAPALKQPYFVGDGRNSAGEVQQIVVPPGATRLFIGNMDAWQWNDNTGGYNATIYSTTSVTTVK